MLCLLTASLILVPLVFISFLHWTSNTHLDTMPVPTMPDDAGHDDLPGAGAALEDEMRISMTTTNRSSCENEVFVVHWTHVPKAGGTAFASLAKKVACKKNPWLAAINPCCIRDVCVAEGSCFSTASTCPFVQGIGKHTSNMDRLAAAPCCGRDWYVTTVVSFLRYALRPVPTREELATFGLAYTADGVERVGGKKSMSSTIATSAGNGRRTQLALRANAYWSWPLERRVEFFSKSGVAIAEIKRRLIEKEVVGEANVQRLVRLATAVAPPQNETYGSRQREESQRFPRPGEKTLSTGRCEVAAEALSAAKDGGKPDRGERTSCCERHSRRGANSMTMLRAPYIRGISAYFYRGHSPNYDNYKLRPGLWAGPNKPRPFDKHWTLREFFWQDEYRNILTKMFGDSTNCDQASRCASQRGKNGGACSMVTGCHAYRNASSYLTREHVDTAFDSIKDHAFFGLLEAYNASVLLASHVFELGQLDPEDFAKSRASASLDRSCSPPRILRNDPSACREAYRAYSLDNLLYERSHRLFCQRLDDAGLLARPEIRAELDRSSLCGDTDFSNPEHICGPLETPEALENLRILRQRCKQSRPDFWKSRFGFYWDGGPL